MLNCHQEFGILWSDLVVLFLKVDSCGNGWVPPGLTNTGITVRFVCINYYALPRICYVVFPFLMLTVRISLFSKYSSQCRLELMDTKCILMFTVLTVEKKCY